jgi:hypothetical protein
MPAAPGRTAGSRAAGAEPLGDLLGDLAAGQVGREHAGRGDRASRAGPVGDDHGAAQAQQDGSAVALRVQPGGQFAQAAALQEGAEARGPGRGDRGPKLGRGEPDGALQGLERDVPGEAVGHDHVDLAGQQVPALHIARERQRERAVRRIGGQQFVRPPGELVPLSGLGPDGEQPDPRGGDAERELRVGHAELAELDEHLRLGIGGGAGVDQDGPARPGGQHHGQPRTVHAGQRPQPQPGGGDHAAGRPGRDHRGRLAAPDQLAGHGHARPRPPQAGQRALIHGQVVLGGHDAQLARVRAQLGQRLPQARGRPGQQDPYAVLAPGRQRTRDDLVRGVIATHGVDGQYRTGRRGSRPRRSGLGRPGLGRSRLGRSGQGWPRSWTAATLGLGLPDGRPSLGALGRGVTQGGSGRRGPPGRQGASFSFPSANCACVVGPLWPGRSPGQPRAPLERPTGRGGSSGSKCGAGTVWAAGGALYDQPRTECVESKSCRMEFPGILPDTSCEAGIRLGGQRPGESRLLTQSHGARRALEIKQSPGLFSRHPRPGG